MTQRYDEGETTADYSSSRWGIWASYGACVGAFLFATLSFYWTFGGTIGADTTSPEITQFAQDRVPGIFVALWITAIIKVFSGVIALALNHTWGKKFLNRYFGSLFGE